MSKRKKKLVSLTLTVRTMW